MKKTQGPFDKNRIFWYLVIASSSSTPSSGLSSASSALFSAVPCLCKNEKNATTIRPKSSQASGWHAKTPNMHFLLYFTMKAGLRTQKPLVFLMVSERPPSGPQEAPKRPTRGFPAATLPSGPQDVPKRPQEAPQEAPKRPPGGPQEAPRSPPRGPQEANQSVKQPITHSINASISQSFNQPSDPSINHPLNQSTHQPIIPGPAECA